MIYLTLILILAIAWIIFSISVWKWHPFISLLLVALAVGVALGLPLVQTVDTIAEGFGSLLASIGVVIVLGSILGTMLEESGAAMVIANTVISGLGRRFPTLAVSFLGAFVGIPVFCDAGFIILSRLTKQMAAQAALPRATLSVGLATGLYTTHTLIPPTPGPIAAAGNLGASDYLGLVMLAGVCVTALSLPLNIGLIRKLTANIKTEVFNAEAELNQEKPVYVGIAKAIFPLLLPLVLISLGTANSFAGWNSSLLSFLGHPVIALLLSILVAFLIFPGKSMEGFYEKVKKGIAAAGPVLIITGAGGAFGNVLKASSLTSSLEQSGLLNTELSWVTLVVAFALAAILKTAQGSSTAAIVITSALLAPMIAVGVPDPWFITLVVMAIGGGAMTFSHANDSYFWVVSQFSQISVKDAYRSYSIVTAVQGLLVLSIVLVLFWIIS